MKKFLVIYYAPAEAMGKMATATDEEKMASMKPWMDWKAAHDANIVDFGAPLMPGTGRGKEGAWTQSSKEVSGYSIIQGSDLETTKALFADHPHIAWAPNCTLEIYEYAQM